MIKRYKMLGIALLAGLFAIGAQAEQRGLYVFKGADEATALRIKYNGSSSTATFTNAATTMVVNDGGVSTTIAGGGMTYATALAAIEAATNSAGAKNFEVEYVAAIATDVASNLMVASSAEIDISDGKWHDIVLMDTSGIKAYPVGIPGDDYGNLYVDHIYGNAIGTGDVTVNVWIDGTKVYEHFIESPVYVPGSMDSLTNVYSADNTVSLNLELPKGIMVPSGKPVAIRATRETTATTGNLGVVFTKR